MKVFKFGGASVKDAEGVKNVARVLREVGHAQTLLVVSAMGKTTNALERVVQLYFEQSPDLQAAVQEVKKYHHLILMDLFPDEQHEVYWEVNQWFADLDYFLRSNKSPNHAFVYDQIVSFGELISSSILSQFLRLDGIDNRWIDARNGIKTDTTYRDAQVDWAVTQKAIQALSTDVRILYVTQGFVGADPNGFTTTLGREGSDYTAAIFAYCLNAQSVTIWKDVPGVLNADPRYFEQTRLLEQISYREAIELAFYGASVIHPKTLQPLQRKEIPLYVKSFVDPIAAGTQVSKGPDLLPQVPCFIVKKNQILLSLSSLDFSFIVEDNMRDVFGLLHQYQIKVSLMQHSAISFSVCLEDKYQQFDALKAELAKNYKVVYNQNVSLYTVRHATPEAQALIEKDRKLLVRQWSRDTWQVVVAESPNE